MATISDRAEGHDDGNGGIDYYIAEVLSQQDYYAFGMQMPYRHFTHGNDVYRYGFNGKENDNDVKGEWNQQDYGMRIYDPWLGRFLSVDPITKEYPWYTPYQFAGNMPIWAIDLDGLEPVLLGAGVSIGNRTSLAVMKEEAILRIKHPGWGSFRIGLTASINVTIGAVHTILDVAGMVPVLGEVADGINGGLYLLQGNKTDAALSFAATISIAGWGATGAKWASKIVGKGKHSLEFTRNSKNLIEFGNRSQLRDVLGITDKVMEAHHKIPWSLAENKVVQQAAEAGFHMNDEINGIALKKYSKESLDGLHGNHPA